MTGKCDVCWILQKDDSLKEVEWCAGCGKWKCARCRKGILRSATALIKHVVRRKQ